MRVTAGGHGTLIQTADGAIYACGDNQFGGLGAGTPVLVPMPARVTTGSVTSGVFVAGGNYAAVSADGCTVRVTGDSDGGVVNASGTGSRTFVPRAALSLCGTRATTKMADVVNPAPRGGASGCWAAPIIEDAAASPRFGGLNQAMTVVEEILKRNPAFVAPLEPVRWRSSKSAGPLEEGGARIHIKVVPERKLDGTRLWTSDCGVIPQLDRIGGAISQISVFFNVDPRGYLIGSTGAVPKLTGRAGGFSEYDNWVLMTKDGRLPWIPVTLAEKLDVEGEKRERALADWKKRMAGMKMPDEAATLKTYEMLKKSDAAGADKFLASARQQRDELARLQRDVYPLQLASLERQLQEYREYRASQSPEALRSPAVRGDISGDGKRQLDADVARLRAIPLAAQQQINALSKQGRAQEARALRQAHAERSAPLIADAIARYDLTNFRAGPAERAISVKPDPSFPNFKEPNRIQLIALMFSMDPNPRNTERREWQQRVKDTFDYTAVAALLK